MRSLVDSVVGGLGWLSRLDCELRESVRKAVTVQQTAIRMKVTGMSMGRLTDTI